MCGFMALYKLDFNFNFNFLSQVSLYIAMPPHYGRMQSGELISRMYCTLYNFLPHVYSVQCNDRCVCLSRYSILSTKKTYDHAVFTNDCSLWRCKMLWKFKGYHPHSPARKLSTSTLILECGKLRNNSLTFAAAKPDSSNILLE